MSATRRARLAQLQSASAAVQAEIDQLTAQMTLAQHMPARELPSDLTTDEAMLVGEIKGMLDSAPTEAMAALVAKLRGTSVENVMQEAEANAAARTRATALPEPEPPTPTTYVAARTAPTLLEPQISTTPEMRSGRACLLRHILLAYFRAHAPECVHKVENLVARVVGGPPSEVNGIVVGGVLWDEATLFGKLEAKYGARVDLDPPP